VDGVIVDPTTRVLTHLLLREDHLWDTRSVCIPLDHVDRVEHNVIYLSLCKQQVKPMATATDI